MAHRDAVVLGIDVRHDNSSAIEWAVADARTRRIPLRIVCAYGRPLYLGGYGTSASNEQQHQMQRGAKQAIARAVDAAAQHAPNLDVRGECVGGPPTEVLLELSRTSSLLVLGTRGRSTLESVLLGSVSSAVSARAHCPVVVVRHAVPQTGTHPRVVVGVDASPNSGTVLAFAFDHASRHALPLRPILCRGKDSYDEALSAVNTPSSEQAARWLAEAIAGWQERYPDVSVSSSVEHVSPVYGLVAAGHAGGLLVVGANGHHAGRRSMLGPVSQGVLHHAPCPVAIVNTQESQPSASTGDSLPTS